MTRIPNPDPNALYREETIADPRVGSIRRMIPITPDGLPDPARHERYIGEITIMTPVGALPLSFEIPATTLSEAIAGFSAAAEKQLERMQDELRRLELEQSSLLAKQALVGGNLGAPSLSGGSGPIPGSRGGSGLIIP
ncbi:MAG: hypothetical protein N2557_04865 [Hydrogenophilus sp.]|nr:hypothetical protein [Hydrogenophilus sp.]